MDGDSRTKGKEERERGLATPEEVCRYLGIPRQTLYGMTHERTIPHYKLGRSLRFKMDEIDAWLEARRAGG